MGLLGLGKSLILAFRAIRVMLKSNKDGLKAIIMLPTRVLAQQTFSFMRLLAINSPGCGTLAVGRDIEEILVEYNRVQPSVIVGCPGPIAHLIKRLHWGDKHAPETLIMDEGDVLLESSFQNDMAAILEASRAARRVMFAFGFAKSLVHRLEAVSYILLLIQMGVPQKQQLRFDESGSPSPRIP